MSAWTPAQVLRAVGAIVDPTDRQAQRAEEQGRFIVAVPDGADDDGDEYLADIRDAIEGSGWSADWTGGSNTSDDGETTSDVRIQRDEDAAD